MNLGEIRATLLEAVLERRISSMSGDGSEASGYRMLDRAFRAAATECVRRTKCSQTTGTVALTASSSVATISLTDFRPERLIEAQARYRDRGTWATATAYSLHDIVTGDGSPNSLLYRCTLAHTSGASSEPPNTTYWTEIHTKLGAPVEHVDLDAVVRDMNHTWPGYDDHHPYNGADAVSGAPMRLAFESFVSGTTGGGTASIHVSPSPDVNMILWLRYHTPLVQWTIGDTSAGGSATIVNIPDEYLEPVIWYGAAAFAEYQDPKARVQSEAWQRFEEHMKRMAGETGLDTGPVLKNLSDLI